MRELEEHLFSIIMPVYNTERFVEDAVRSVINQTYTEWELILVNDGSCASCGHLLQSLAQQDERICLIDLPARRGPANARNAGIEQARGRYLAFLDSDDWWAYNKLEKQYTFMQMTKAAFIFGSYELAYEDGKSMGQMVKAPYSLDYQEALVKTPIGTMTVCLDRCQTGNIHMVQIGDASEDLVLWLELLKRIPCAYGMQEILGVYRQVRDSQSHHLKKRLSRTWLVYRKAERLSLAKSVMLFLRHVRYIVGKKVAIDRKEAADKRDEQQKED